MQNFITLFKRKQSWSSIEPSHWEVFKFHLNMHYLTKNKCQLSSQLFCFFIYVNYNLNNNSTSMKAWVDSMLHICKKELAPSWENPDQDKATLNFKHMLTEPWWYSWRCLNLGGTCKLLSKFPWFFKYKMRQSTAPLWNTILLNCVILMDLDTQVTT